MISRHQSSMKYITICYHMNDSGAAGFGNFSIINMHQPIKLLNQKERLFLIKFIRIQI
jgi:hypothetical protein